MCCRAALVEPYLNGNMYAIQAKPEDLLKSRRAFLLAGMGP